MRGFVMGYIAGIATLYVAMCFHVVRAKDGFHLVPKSTASLKDPYVDIREFGVAEWQEHPELAADISLANKTDMLQDSASDTVHRKFDDLFRRKN